MSAALKFDGKLEVFQNGQLLQEISLAKDDLWLGRDEDCVVRLDDRAISRRHALIRSTSDGFEFEKKSKFGWAKLNGQEMSQAMLKEGDRLELGPYEILVRLSQAEAAREAPVVVPNIPAIEAPAPALEVTRAAIPAPDQQNNDFAFEQNVPEGISALELNVAAPAFDQHSVDSTNAQLDLSQAQPDGITKVFTAPDKVKAILEFSDGAANVSKYEIGDNEIAIGRSQQCHVVLEDKKSSRKHSIIKRDGLKYLIKDLGSANGTLVNGLRIDEQELHSGDQIQIGETSFTFQLVQADYEVKKEAFIQVPPQESQQAVAPMMESHSMLDSMQVDSMPPPGTVPPAANQFEIPAAPKKSFIGQFLDRYRAMNTKQQIIYGVAILAGIYYMMDDDAPERKAKLNTGAPKKVQMKKDEKKPGVGPSYETLTPEQQRYIDTQYQLAFDLYKNRDYDKSLLEISKIFSLVQDYKNAREIEAFAREGKRKLEAQEEDRKRKESERQAQLKLQSLLEQAGALMDHKKFQEAEALFPEIELIQPENAAVSEWRKQIMAQADVMEKEREAEKNSKEILRRGWADFQAGVNLEKEGQYIAAIDQFYEVLDRSPRDKKLVQNLNEEIQKSEDAISAARDPLLQQGKQLEQDGKLAEAFKAYEKAAEVDPDGDEAPAGMKRIRGTLTSRARYLYTEGVFAESYSDYETAEKRYREVLDAAPKNDDYYLKAETRLKRITVLKKPGGEVAQ